MPKTVFKKIDPFHNNLCILDARVENLFIYIQSNVLSERRSIEDQMGKTLIGFKKNNY